MAIKLLSLFLLLTAIAAVSARPGIPFHPCNTLIISTYSFSLHPNPDFPSLRNPNPNPNPDFIFMDLRPVIHPRHRHFLLNHRSRHFSFDNPQFVAPKTTPQITDLPLGFSSLKERTRDILSVVASLLFGAACGALTAGTMYLIWSIVNYRHHDYRNVDGFSSDDDDNDDNDDLFNPKKPHYVAIPAVAAAAPLDDKDANANAKEAV